MAHLEELLQACPASKRKLVITDSLFSMDGDFADLHGLVALRRRYGFALALDEAHATLVAGDRYRPGSCSSWLSCSQTSSLTGVESYLYIYSCNQVCHY